MRRRLGKLVSTPPHRLAGRLRDELRQEVVRLPLSRAAKDRGRLARDRILPVELEEALASTRTAGLSLGAWAEAVAATRADTALRGALKRRRARALGGRYELFGYEPVELGSPPPWHRDLRTGQPWPRAYYRRISYAELDRRSDVKYAWELSRLRNCVALAQATVTFDDQRSLTALDRELRDWHAENPVGHGINWTCAMEVALRAVNLICVDALLAGCERTEELRGLLVRSLYQHGWFLARNLEISPVNGNHFLADGVGLIWLGRHFGTIGEAPAWRARGRQMVLEAAREQVLADGLDHEGSLPYHLLVLELFLTAFAAEPEELVPIIPALRQMTDAACKFTDSAGRVPNIGDDDGARVLALSDAPSRDARRVLCLAAGLLDHEHARARAGHACPEDSLWLLGPRSLPNRPRSAIRSSPTPAHMEAGGIVVLGDGRDHVVADFGPVGFRGIGGHGHLDAMSFEASLDGDIAVRDSGTATYTGDAVLRDRLRDAPAHNVVVVDGLAYARLGPTLWSVTGDSAPVEIEVESDHLRQSAQASQVLPAALGEAKHRRGLIWSPGRLECHDRVDAPAASLVTHYFQLPPSARREGSSIVSTRFSYALEVPGDAEVTLEDADRSERYGSLESGKRAVVRYESSGRKSDLRLIVTLR